MKHSTKSLYLYSGWGRALPVDGVLDSIGRGTYIYLARLFNKAYELDAWAASGPAVTQGKTESLYGVLKPSRTVMGDRVGALMLWQQQYDQTQENVYHNVLLDKWLAKGVALT